VIDNVCCAELQDALVFLIEGFRSSSINFGVFNNIGFAIFENDEADGLGCVSLSDDLGGEVNIL